MAKRKGKIGDFLELGANAFASGLLVAIALAAITLLLATSSQAATVLRAVRGDPPWSVALTSTPQTDAAGVSALWASAKITA